MLENESGIHPKGWAILVKPLEIEETTEGGIVIAKRTLEKEQAAQSQGILIDKGSFAWNDEQEPRAEIGEMVVFSRYKGEVLAGNDGANYRIINDKDVIAVIDNPLDPQLKVRDRTGLDAKVSQGA